MRKPVLVDRHIPRELKTLWQRLVMQLLTEEQSRTDVYPIASDLVFILPKLVLSRPPGKEKAKDRLHRIQDGLQKASQGEWKGLIEGVLETPIPKYEQDAGQVPIAFLRGLQKGFTKQRPRDSWGRRGGSSERPRQSS